MNAHRSVMMAAAIAAVGGLTACAGSVPASPHIYSGNAGNVAVGARQVLSVQPGVKSFADLLARLPQQISLTDAKRMLRSIDPSKVHPLDQQHKYSLMVFTGLNFDPTAVGVVAPQALGTLPVADIGTYGSSWADSPLISGAYSTAFASQMSSLSYLGYGNLLFPYQQCGAVMQPYVVDKQDIPFFIEKTTVAVPQVTQVAQDIEVPRCVTVQQPVTVAQSIQVPTEVDVPTTVNTQQVVNVPTVINVPATVNVPTTVMQEAIVPVQTSVPVQTTVIDHATVLQPVVSTSLVQSTNLVGPDGSIVPMSYAPDIAPAAMPVAMPAQTTTIVMPAPQQEAQPAQPAEPVIEAPATTPTKTE